MSHFVAGLCTTPGDLDLRLLAHEMASRVTLSMYNVHTKSKVYAIFQSRSISPLAVGTRRPRAIGRPSDLEVQLSALECLSLTAFHVFNFFHQIGSLYILFLFPVWALCGTVTLTFDLLTSKLIHKLSVTPATFLLIWSFLEILFLELGQTRYRQTDGIQWQIGSPELTTG